MLQIRYIWGEDKLQIKDSETNGLLDVKPRRIDQI